MKKIILLSLFSLAIVFNADAQGRGNGNGQNKTSNNWGQNGNGNAYGQNNNNGNNGNNGGGSGSGSGSSSIGGGSGSSSSGGGTSSSAGQATYLALSNAIEMTFTGSGGGIGSDVTLAFSTVNDYANGIESGEQELKIRSNKNFSVAVKSNATNFTYNGNTTPAPTMPVSGVLAMKVTSNSTGGSVSSPFSTSSYSTLSSSNQGLISAGSRGGNQTFGVKYKATPGFAYPAGTYTVDVVYTATQQ